jgi:hypothetical protein
VIQRADLPPPPRRPADYECCRRGCCPCIFDYYERALTRWREKVEALGADPDALLAADGG